MRVVMVMVTLASVVTLATAYSSDKVINYMAYADNVSREYSRGDNHNPYGWRTCEKAQVAPKEIGVVCEGTRSILIHGGRLVDVNYYCEFQFTKSGEAWKVSLALCQ